MSYGADFATADPANAPLDPPLFIGADPFVWTALLLLLAAFLLLGYWLGARSNARRGDAAGSIWTAVDDAAKAAMKADDNALKGKAERLLAVIDARLGKTIAFVSGSGLFGKVDALRHAVEGRRPHDHGHEHGHGHGHEDAHGNDHGHDAPAHDNHSPRHGEPAPSSAAAAAASITIVTVAPTAPPPPAPTGGHPPRGLTAREQTDALRLAVAAFNQHWRDETARVAEMRAALAELSGGGRTGH